MHVDIKTEKEIETMREGGKILGEIRDELASMVAPGISAAQIDERAEELIKKHGGSPSFKMVPDYFWSTCVNVNSGVVHGIPKKELIFKMGDVVSVDVGIFYKGFHTDTSTTVYLGKDPVVERFIKTGKLALKRGIEQALIGNEIFDISASIEAVLTDAGYSPIKALTGHGVGRELHEEPYIPCFVPKKGFASYTIEEGATLAIEVMYTMGSPDIGHDQDGWTIRTKDGKISALFEETVAVKKNGPFILTQKQ